MDKKGFTLVELLAVIIILTLLALLTSTAVIKLVKDSKEELSNTQFELIKSAAETWGADNLAKLPDTGKCGYLTLLDLKEYGLIDSGVIDPNTNQGISDELKIKVTTTTSSYGNVVTSYEVNPESIDGCTKIYDTICTAVSTSTTGNVPAGDFLPGDEYSCEVKPGTSYTFFVLSTEGNKVNLIMNSNISENQVEWCMQSDYIDFGGSEEDWNNNIMNNKGPITATKFLNQATSDWSNIEYLNELYDDAGDNYTDFVLNGKARFPKLSELNYIGCSETENSCPAWINAIQSEVFWTLDSVSSSTEYAWSVTTILGKLTGIPPEEDNFLTVAYSNGVRPVITVSKYRIQNEIVEES